MVLKDVTIKSLANVNQSYFKNIYINDGLELPKEHNSVNINGMTYDTIRINNENNLSQSDKLLDFINKSKFNLNNYIQLADYFQRLGSRDISNKIFIKGKWKECQKEIIDQWWRPLNWIAFLGSVLWGLLTGFGREPIRAFVFALGFVFFGACCFGPKYLKKGHWFSILSLDHNYLSRFLVSLDRFLPGVNLGVSDLWEPTDNSKIIKIYWNIHKLLGWIIIPIGLAAIFTQIK